MPTGTQGGDARLGRSLSLITIAGCLYMVFATCTAGPAFTQFLRAMGASEVHFGLLAGLPSIMVVMQFLGAAIGNYVPRRKPLFMVLVIGGRLLYLPVAFLPLLAPGLGTAVNVGLIVALIAVSGAMNSVTGPLWLSWMADIIPTARLNRYWGSRQRWTYVIWTVSSLAVALLTFLSDLPIRILFPSLAVIGVVSGVADILLFTTIDEPPNALVRGKAILATALAPLRNPDFRSFIVFSCMWSAVAMFAAAFMQLYVLKELEVPLWKTTVIWCTAGVGPALTSSLWGRLADRYGHRPIFRVCTRLKPLIALTFFLINRETAIWALPLAMALDSVLNAGMMVASNGYTLKMSPRENRSMFIAAMAGLTGIAGGLGAMAGGHFLVLTQGVSARVLGMDINNYRLLFAVNVFMRIACWPVVRRIREPSSSVSSLVLQELLYTVTTEWPLRFLMLPVTLYRRLGTAGGNDPSEKKRKAP